MGPAAVLPRYNGFNNDLVFLLFNPLCSEYTGLLGAVRIPEVRLPNNDTRTVHAPEILRNANGFFSVRE